MLAVGDKEGGVMDKEEKSLIFAELMGWKELTLIEDGGSTRMVRINSTLACEPLEPYAEDDHGQFKAILLKYIKVMERFD